MASEIHKEEVASGNAVEAKAGTLMSALGVAASLLVAAGALLFTDGQPMGHSQRLIGSVTLCFLTAAILLGVAFFHGFRALRVGNVARPSPRTFLDVQCVATCPGGGDATLELKRRQLADLLVSHHRNRAANNEKAAYLNEGYRWALWSVAALLLAGTLIATHALYPILCDWWRELT